MDGEVENIVSSDDRKAIMVIYAVLYTNGFPWSSIAVPDWSLLQMISAARIIEYTKLQPEAPLEMPPGKPKPPEKWPQRGAIHLHKLKFRYAEDTPYILKGISADIKTGEKVCVQMH